MKIYQIWYIEGDFWGILGCKVYILHNDSGVLGRLLMWLTSKTIVGGSPKVAETPRNSGKMAYFALVLPIFVQISCLGAR